MGEIVGLGKVRKQRARAEKDAQAAQNRLKFGRTRAEREIEAARLARADKRLDDHKVDAGEAKEP